MHVYIIGDNVTRVISLSDEAYNELKQLKQQAESFSIVVLRLAKKEKAVSFKSFSGKWAGSSKELKQIEKQLHNDRKKFSLNKNIF